MYNVKWYTRTFLQDNRSDEWNSFTIMFIFRFFFFFLKTSQHTGFVLLLCNFSTAKYWTDDWCDSMQLADNTQW